MTCHADENGKAKIDADLGKCTQMDLVACTLMVSMIYKYMPGIINKTYDHYERSRWHIEQNGFDKLQQYNN